MSTKDNKVADVLTMSGLSAYALRKTKTQKHKEIATKIVELKLVVFLNMVLLKIL